MSSRPSGGYCALWSAGVGQPPRDEVQLLCTVLRGVPRFDGRPMCRDLARLFDGEDASSAAVALSFCRSCPALRDCRAWAQRQPVGSLSGVVAGQVFSTGAEAPTTTKFGEPV